jgi:hypothetical protein
VSRIIYRHQSGQSLIEFVLVVTLFVTLLLGVVDFALAYYTQVTIKNAVAEAGYYANQHPHDDDGIPASIRQQLADLVDVGDSGIDQNSNIVINHGCTSGAGRTTISMTYQHTLLFNRPGDYVGGADAGGYDRRRRPGARPAGSVYDLQWRQRRVILYRPRQIAALKQIAKNVNRKDCQAALGFTFFVYPSPSRPIFQRR